MRQRAHLGMRGGFLSDMDCWIAKEVSAISFPDTLENLLKSISGCRDVHSTLSVVPLDATKLTDGKLLFKLFFYIQEFQEPLYTSVMIGPVSKEFLCVLSDLTKSCKQQRPSTYTRQSN